MTPDHFYFVNSGSRVHERFSIQSQLLSFGIDCRRHPVTSRRSFNPRFKNKDNNRSVDESDYLSYYYYENVAIALLLRKLRNLNFESIAIFGDDVILHPNFSDILYGLEPPDDWGIFFLGFNHQAKPIIVNCSIVCATDGEAPLAIIVRKKAIKTIMRCLRVERLTMKESGVATRSFSTAARQSFPCYSCFPDIAHRFPDNNPSSFSATEIHDNEAQLIARKTIPIA